MFVWPIAAVLVIIAAVWFLGARDSVGFPTDDAVRAILRDEHPEFTPVEIVRSTHLQSALARGAGDAVAVAFTAGNQATSRLLHPGDVRSVSEAPRVGLVDAAIHTRDVGCPVLELTLPDGAWAQWRPRLERLAVGAILLVAAASPRSASGQPDCGDSLRVTTDPASPRQGTFFRVRVSGIPPGALLTGAAGDEPLHFEAHDPAAGSATTLAGAPIDASGSLGLTITCVAGERADTVAQTLVVRAGSYPVERLRVAPEFAAEPDSALAARIARESARAREVALASHATPRLWRGPFVLPRRARITSRYGRGRQFNGRITSRHMGTDFAGATGASVRAVNRGVVRIVDRFYYGGNVVYVDHGDGLTTAYLHLSRHLVALGDTVAAGQEIGKVGATGRVTGPHLHLIARYGTMSLDAVSLFALEGDAEARAATAVRRAAPPAAAAPRRPPGAAREE
jgi:hypothetical protein